MITFETILYPAGHPLAGSTDYKIIKIHHKDSEERLKQLFHRALNTWADAHPELKELGDIMEHGKARQDYYSQRSDIKHGRSTQELLLDGTKFELLPLPELDKTKP